MHEEAMSAMDGNAKDDEDSQGNGDYIAQACASLLAKGCMETVCSADESFEGEKMRGVGGCNAIAFSFTRLEMVMRRIGLSTWYMCVRCTLKKPLE